MSKKKPPPEPFYNLTDERICREDHLRLARDIVRDVGPAAMVVAAIYIASAGAKCFVSQDKLARVACCSRRTVIRAVAPDGPLVSNGWLEYLGRERFSKRVPNVRRTVSVRLTKKAIAALEDRYHALPRAILAVFKANPLTWSECLVLAEVCSRHILTLVNDGAGAVGREWVSIRDLERATGLCRRSIISARLGLVAKRAIQDPDYNDDEGMEMCLHLTSGLYESALPPTAVEILKSTTSPGREWQPPQPKRDTRAKEPPVQECHSTGCNLVTEGVQGCHSSGCKVVTGPGANVSQGGCKVVTCNDLPLRPTSVTYRSDLPLRPTEGNPNVTASGDATGASLKLGGGKASQGGKLTEADLRDTPKVLKWFLSEYPGSCSEHDQIEALAAAEAALRTGKNPPGLFRDILRRKSVTSISADDEHRASIRWIEHKANQPHRASDDAKRQPSSVEAELAKLVAATKGGAV